MGAPAVASSALVSISGLQIVEDCGTGIDIERYASLLRQCSHARALLQGKRIHLHIIRSGCHQDRYLSNLLVQMYGQCGSLHDARRVFDQISERNVFSWTIMITAYAQNGYFEDARALFVKMPRRSVVAWNALIAAYAQRGHGEEAVLLFMRMLLEGERPDRVTFLNILDACASFGALAEGKAIHGHIVESGFQADVMVGTAIVNMYGKCGDPQVARKVFESLAQRNVVTWNAMVTAYTQNGYLEEGRKIFEEMPVRDVESWNTLIAAYAQNGHMQEARRVFDEMPQRDVVSWNSMISSYCEHGDWKQSLKLFRIMDIEGLQPDKVTFVSTLDACASLVAIREGKIIHDELADAAFPFDVAVATAVVNMYGKCGNLEEARRMFEKMPLRNVISWNAMIAAYGQNGRGKEALQVFRMMDLEGIYPSNITAINILDACAGLAVLGVCRVLHATIAETSFISDVAVGTAIVQMYGKCGSLEDAWRAFDKMPVQNALSWTVMVAAYAQNGHSQEATNLFHAMQLEGVKPHAITLTVVLSQCSHAGKVDEAWQLFISMYSDHGIKPVAEHYRCMIDLLGRAGRLDEAEGMMNKMPFSVDILTWNTLLGACKIHGEMKHGARIGNNLLKLDPENAASYVLLSNVFTVGNEEQNRTGCS